MKSFFVRLATLTGAVGAMVNVACSAASEAPSQSNEPAAEYKVPNTPVIRPNSLVGFEVSSNGQVKPIPESQFPGKRTENWDWGDEAAHYASSGTGIEVEDILSPGYVLTGIGGRVAGGAVTRIRLKQIGIRNDWSWDPVGAHWVAWVRHSTDDGQNTAELSLEVAKPYVVVGIGMGISDQNLKTIRLTKREYSPSQRKLIGAEFEDQIGPGAGELYWNTSYITHPAGMKEKMVVVGVGLRENNDNLATLKVYAAYLD